MIRNLPNSAGYSDSKGIFAARKAVMHYTQQQGIKGVTLDDIYLGNGASELIAMATNALLKLSADQVAQVRAAAAKSLAGNKDDRAVKRRAELGNDPDPIVRAAAKAQ